MNDSTPSGGLKIDSQKVSEAISLICDGGVTEVRALEATVAGDRWSKTYSGYFNNPVKLAEAVSTIRSAKGVYFVPNELNPALFSRAANRLVKAGKGTATQDSDILRRRWLLIDCDAQRPTGISSTDAEHEQAIERCRTIYQSLKAQGWPDPIATDSGNGGHLLYRVDLPSADDGLVERCLKSLALQFDDDKVRVDTTVHNQARIWKLYGTIACKGDSTSERPHRMSKILSRPETIEVVLAELLDALAENSPSPEQQTPGPSRNGRAFDIEGFFQRHGLDVSEPHHSSDKTVWEFNTSPLCDHGGDGPFLIQFASGALSAGCHHNSCSWTWADLRRRFEPADGKSSNTTQNLVDSQPPELAVQSYQPFPLHALPDVLEEFVSASSKSFVCDESFVVLPLLCGLASSVGATRLLKLSDTWTEPCVLWGAVVSTSGSQKSPAQKLALAPLEEAQEYHIEQEPEMRKQYENDMKLYEMDFREWNKKGRANGDPQPEEPIPHLTVRYVVDNTTIEALSARLQDNQRGLLVAADELSAWLGSMGRYASGAAQGEKAQWLSMFRAERLLHDRGRYDKQTTYVKHAAVSICGGVPPKTLRKMIAGEDMDNGMAARLLIAMPPKRAKRWSTARVSPQLKGRVARIYSRLLALEFADGDPVRLRLTPEAEEVAIRFVNCHGDEQLSLEDELQSVWSKLEAVAFRLAMLFSLVRWAEGERPASETSDVEFQDMVAAIKLTEWFCREWMRFYETFGETDEQLEERKLVELIQRKGGNVTPRDLMRSSRRFRKSVEAEAALELLAKAGMGRWQYVEHQGGPGRPVRKFVLSTVDTIGADTIRLDPEKNEHCVNVNAVNTQPIHPSGRHQSDA